MTESLPTIKNTIARLIHNSKIIKHLNQIHSQIITSPHLSSIDQSFLLTRFLFHLCTVSDSPNSLHYAKQIFTLFSRPSLFSYNAMIRANATKLNNPFSCESLILYKQLLHCNLKPDCITLPFVLKECGKRRDVKTGRGVHCHSLMFGFERDVYVQNGLMSLYCESGVLEDAKKMFDEMLERDVVSWNTIISGCLRVGELDEALGLFVGMKERKNVITWNSVITGLVQGGRAKEALEWFYKMQVYGENRGGIYPDKVTVASVISACAALGAIDHGRWVYSYLERSGIECDMVIGTALVDMYGKCGCVEKAFEVFMGMPDKDVAAWTAMISVLALHGYGNEAFGIFADMEAEGVRPNSVTCTGLLSACAHSGLVDKGRWIFERMVRVHRIKPEVQHYACMVDLLGRSGLFFEAEELIRSMPMKPDVFVWGALLGGCQMHGNVKLGEKVAQYLIELEPLNHAFYMNLCDLYAKSGRFDDAKRIRSLMKEQEIRKSIPGCSMIEIDGVVHEFSVRGADGRLMEALSDVLILLRNEMKINLGCIIRLSLDE